MTTEKDKSTKQILKRIERLEEAVFGSRQPKEVKARPRKAEGMALPDHILKLRDTGFFDSAKTSSEVHARLQTKYPRSEEHTSELQSPVHLVCRLLLEKKKKKKKK